MDYEIKTPPKEFTDKFKHVDVDFEVDEFEVMILQDVYRYDKETLEKISRDVSEIFKNWVYTKLSKKENISLNVKGGTREGKSLGSLAFSDLIIDYYKDIKFDKSFDTQKIVCGNQKEYRQKLKDADFGDVYQIDENAFANVGVGSSTEMLQLKDIQNIIAKKNIHTIYITPREFLSTNASLGIATFGRDSKNWLSRFLLYDLRKRHSPLMGYIVIDVGKLFRKYGCYMYKTIGGCTNPAKLKLNEIPSDEVKYSSCIPQDFKDEDIETDVKKGCPFYNICRHPLCSYEHKKDSWIEKEMSGGMDERTYDRYLTCFRLLEKISFYNEEKGTIMLKARDGKQLKIKVNLYLGGVTNTKFTQLELDEIITMLRSLCSLDFYRETCKQMELDFETEFEKIPRE